jgi:hypothetical protein
MKLTLYTHRFKNPQDQNVHVFTILEDKTKDILFQVYYQVSKIEAVTCIKQLESIKFDVLQLCKDLYNHRTDYLEHPIDWDKQIVPLIKNNKYRQIVF